jgi:DNA-binding NarL/FixJ family response regulator
VALGVLELGLSRVEAAVEHLRRADDALQRVRLVDPGFLLTRPLLVEALARQGETAEAERLLDGYELTVDATGRQLGRALAARCRGLLAGDDGYEACFARAIALHPAGDRPFELARTQLALGERRRRARRRAAAREPLSAALATFERLGATLWAARARRELELSGTPAGTGAPEASAGTSAIDELTPQELRIALLVGRGLANRQIAGSLFVSTRTVEAHLRQIYRKLDLRSRTELARMIARAAPHLD